MTARGSVPQHLLNPETLAGLANLDLVARAVVNGFLTGLHRSPFFGFSQEFAEYRAYAEGDDPRFVDWNVYARTDRTYIKRYIGETNTRLVILLDASASMGFGSGRIKESTLDIKIPLLVIRLASTTLPVAGSWGWPLALPMMTTI